jgi:hypothetical protein
METDIGTVMDLIHSAKEYVSEVAEKFAVKREQVKLIRSTVDAGLLDIDGQLLHLLEFRVMSASASLRGAEGSLVEADKQLNRAALHDAEAHVSVRLESGEQLEAEGDRGDALGQARGRSEEARAFAKLCDERTKGMEIPTLRIG